jgi:hypothetical protein
MIVWSQDMSQFRYVLVPILGMLLLTPGCQSSAFVVGNFASMAIVLVMLWSTLNIRRD